MIKFHLYQQPENPLWATGAVPDEKKHGSFIKT
jgi:hypothetical protein